MGTDAPGFSRRSRQIAAGVVAALALSACGSSEDAQVVVESGERVDPAARLASAAIDCTDGVEIVTTYNGELASRFQADGGRGVGSIGVGSIGLGALGSTFGDATDPEADVMSTAFDADVLYVEVGDEWFSTTIGDDESAAAMASSIDQCGISVDRFLDQPAGDVYADPDDPDALVVVVPGTEKSTSPSEDDIRAIRDGDQRAVVLFDDAGRVSEVDLRSDFGELATEWGLEPVSHTVATFRYGPQSIDVPSAATELSSSDFSLKMLEPLQGPGGIPVVPPDEMLSPTTMLLPQD